MKLLNVDPLNEANRIDRDTARWLGIDGVRLVSRDDQAVRDYADVVRAAGLRVLAVVARESEGYVLPNAHLVQLGNEPDGRGESSWRMTADEYLSLWQLYTATYPDLTWIAAGLCSGDVGWWGYVYPRMSNVCAGVAVHPYGQTVEGGRRLLRAYRAVSPPVACWVTEWWQPDILVVPFARMLGQEAEAHAWYTAGGGGFGLFDDDGRPTPQAHLFAAAG